MSNSIDYCVDLVQSRDRDRYWCAMLASTAYRNDLFALYAFNIEIAEIGGSVSEPLIGQMRLRWWLDSLTPIFGGNPPKHPVAVALSEMVSRRGIQRNLLENYLETRERDMDNGPFAHLAELKSYAEGTSSTLMALSMDITGSMNETARQRARALGVAWAYLGLIRSIPYQLQAGSVQLPLDLCETHNFDRQSMLDHGYRDQPPEGLVDVVSALINEIRIIQTDDVSIRQSIGSKYAPPLLLKILISGYLQELEVAGNDPFQLNMWRKGPRLSDMIKLKWAALIKSV